MADGRSEKIRQLAEEYPLTEAEAEEIRRLLPPVRAPQAGAARRPKDES
jgi:hypothetical protein